MNSISILFCYLIADDKVKHYNVLEPQKVKNIALMIGSFSQNLAINYLMIDNLTKNLQQNLPTVIPVEPIIAEIPCINPKTEEIKAEKI